MAIELVPETVIEQGSYWTLATNLNQNLIGRLVLVLRRDRTSVVDVLPDEWLSLHEEIRRTRSALDRLFCPDQYNYAFLMNADAQVHLHVVPRYREPRKWRGQRFEDAHYGELFGREQRVLDAAELGRLAEDVREHLPSCTQPDRTSRRRRPRQLTATGDGDLPGQQHGRKISRG